MGIAHRKGENYKKLVKKLKISEKSFIKSFEDILREAISLLDYLRLKFL